ncbi:MAG: hypothetical protein KDA84_04960 [Planctomycetaceae bacterium]|nr:hypothetical protein [Planctomycetaceae bacterium]
MYDSWSQRPQTSLTQLKRLISDDKDTMQTAWAELDEILKPIIRRFCASQTSSDAEDLYQEIIQSIPASLKLHVETWESERNNRQEIVFEPGEDEVEVVVKLHSTASDAVKIDYFKAGQQGRHLRFEDENKNVLNSAVEVWNPSGYSSVRVRVSANSTTANRIWLHYANFLPWVFGLMKHKLKDHNRNEVPWRKATGGTTAQRRQMEIPAKEQGEGKWDFNQFYDEVLWAIMKIEQSRELDRLNNPTTKEQRRIKWEAYRLKVFEKLTDEEISEKLGTEKANIRQYVSRVRRRLRECYPEELEPHELDELLSQARDLPGEPHS